MSYHSQRREETIQVREEILTGSGCCRRPRNKDIVSGLESMQNDTERLSNESLDPVTNNGITDFSADRYPNTGMPQDIRCIKEQKRS